jgi:hypothetical protein
LPTASILDPAPHIIRPTSPIQPTSNPISPIQAISTLPSILGPYHFQKNSPNSPTLIPEPNISPSISHNPNPIDTQLASAAPPYHTEIQHSSTNIHPSHTTSIPNTLLPSHSMQTRSKSGISKKKIFSTTCTPNYLQTEPPTYKIASQTPEWCATMASEFEALQRQSTWSLVPSSPAQNVIGCRWFYKIKRNTDSSVSWYKARLVAKGFHQQAGVDYVETFSSVVKPPTIHIILSLAAQNRWSLCQLDESNAFLHGLLKESVFMAQLVGFVDQDHPSHVCQLHKSLYGLK